MQRLLDFLKRGRYFLLLLLLEAVGFLLVCAQYDYHKSLWAGIWGDARLCDERKGGGMASAFLLCPGKCAFGARKTPVCAACSPATTSGWRLCPIRATLCGRTVRSKSYIPATVVKNSYTGERNYLVLDRGQKDGVEPDMGVVTARRRIGSGGTGNAPVQCLPFDPAYG